MIKISTFSYLKHKYKDKIILYNNSITNMMEYENYMYNLDNKDRSKLEEKILLSVDKKYDSIWTVTDSETRDQERLYATTDESNTEIIAFLKNKLGFKIGVIRPWVDKDNILPWEFKNTDNIVIDPDTNDEAIEIEIFRDNQDLCTLPKKIYREYNYIPPKYLQPTNEVENMIF